MDEEVEVTSIYFDGQMLEDIGLITQLLNWAKNLPIPEQKRISFYFSRNHIFCNGITVRTINGGRTLVEVIVGNHVHKDLSKGD